jgi:hypothetical protein
MSLFRIPLREPLLQRHYIGKDALVQTRMVFVQDAFGATETSENIIKGVKVCGLTSVNGRIYPPEAMWPRVVNVRALQLGLQFAEPVLQLFALPIVALDDPLPDLAVARPRAKTITPTTSRSWDCRPDRDADGLGGAGEVVPLLMRDPFEWVAVYDGSFCQYAVRQ